MRCCVSVVAGVACAGVLTLGGCASNAPVADTAGLGQVRSAILTGDLAGARARLARYQGGDPTAALLEAEIDLRQGDAAAALQRASGVTDARYRARTDEVSGKALIRLARFGEASERFRSARGAYQRPEDVARVTDLIWLSDGLLALEQGRPLDARASWSEIRSANLRASIGREYETLTAASRGIENEYELGGEE